MSLTKKQIIEKLKNLQCDAEHIFIDKQGFFEHCLTEERNKENFDYGYISHISHEVYMAQNILETINEIVGEN